MNIKSLYPLPLCVLLLCSCDFSESGCIREGRLKAYCNFTGFPEWLSATEAAERHVIRYPRSGEHASWGEETFSGDTLHWRIPAGDYDFLYYNSRGKDSIRYKEDLYKAEICALVTEKDGKSYISAGEEFICSQVSRQSIIPYRTTACEFKPAPLVQQVNIELSLTGKIPSLDSIKSSLEGITTGRYLESRAKSSGHAVLEFSYKEADTDKWRKSFYIYGIAPAVPSLLAIRTYASDAPDGTYTIDLSEILHPFTKDRIDIFLSVELGDRMEITGVEIKSWEEEYFEDFTTK